MLSIVLIIHCSKSPVFGDHMSQLSIKTSGYSDTVAPGYNVCPTCEKQQLQHLLTSIKTPITHLAFRRKHPFLYANIDVAPPSYSARPRPLLLIKCNHLVFTPLSVQGNYSMAKKFSVAWLCQSSQPDCCSGLEGALVHSPVALQPKHAPHTGGHKDVTKIPPSPSSKHGNCNGQVTSYP